MKSELYYSLEIMSTYQKMDWCIQWRPAASPSGPGHSLSQPLGYTGCCSCASSFVLLWELPSAKGNHLVQSYTCSPGAITSKDKNHWRSTKKAWLLCLTEYNSEGPSRLPGTPCDQLVSLLRQSQPTFPLPSLPHRVDPKATNSPSISHADLSLRASFPGHTTWDNIYDQRAVFLCRELR